jgi:rubrerythrin
MHETYFLEYEVDWSEKKIKKDIKNRMDEMCLLENGIEGNCSVGNIRFLDHIFDNEEDAQKYMERHERNWMDDMAVKYKTLDNSNFLSEDKTYQKLKDRYKRLSSRYNELEKNIHYLGVKSEYVTCRSCGSKLNTSFIRKIGNTCPICGADLRPQSTLQQIQNSKKNSEKAKKDMIEREKYLAKRHGKIMWLVKIGV